MYSGTASLCGSRRGPHGLGTVEVLLFFCVDPACSNTGGFLFCFVLFCFGTSSRCIFNHLFLKAYRPVANRSLQGPVTLLL